jgi:uroporphyrinogen-III decarboxylase
MGKDVFHEKIEKFRDAMAFRKTKTTPLLSNVTGWMVNDSSFSPAEAYYDPETMKKVVIEFGKRYEFDAYQINGFVYMFPVYDALGGGSYKLDKRTGVISVTDQNLISPEEYVEYAADPDGFMRKAFERKHPNLTTPMFTDAMARFIDWGAYAGSAGEKIFKKILQRPLTNRMDSISMSPLEILMNAGLRGIKDLSIDIRRHSAELRIFLDACWEKTQLPTLRKNIEQGQPDYICDIYTSLLAHSILSVRQFEELYWPYFKELVDMTAAGGRRIHIFCEGEMLRFAEFFQDIPKGISILHLEQDDIREVRRQCPNLCLAGGFPIELLGNGTPEQCIEEAKRLINDMGEGFILSTTKLAAYENDVRRENLLAVNEFVRGYEA